MEKDDLGINFEDISLTRRGLLKAMATAGLLGGSLGCGLSKVAGQAAIPEAPKWNRETDVVVVGFGAAGAAAAITAHDAGAKVILLEKQPKGKEGGNSRVSGNLYLCPLPEKEKQFAEYLKNCDFWDQLPDEVSNAAAAEYVKNEEWLKKMGANIVTFPFPAEVLVPGGESVRCATHDGKLGKEAMWKVIAPNVTNRGIEILYHTPGKRLVQTCEGEIIGLIAESRGKEIAIKARRGVVLTTGGYEYDEQMQKDYSPAYPICYFGTPADTGDGVRMAQAVGAELWHMNNVMGAICGGLKVPEYEAPLFTSFGILGALTGAPVHGFLFADKFGKRFMDEVKDSRHGWGWREILYFNAEEMTYPMIPWYAIFDEKTRTGGPLGTTFGGWAAIIEGMKWSPDNSAEIAKGWIIKANSIDELGKKILARKANEGKMSAAQLEEAVTRYNKFCIHGKDPDFHRPGKTLQPLNTPPFYAMELWPASVNTQGGPKRGPDGRIVDVWGKPIPRLYSAGELGSIWASLYQGTGNLGECLAFGRISGRNAAAEKPWR